MLGVCIVLALDLGVFHRRAHTITLREASAWSVIWVVVALLFNGGVYLWLGATAGKEFFTGYLIERALSIDNLFVFVAPLPALRRSRPLPAPGALLGHPRCPGDARGIIASGAALITSSTGSSTSSGPS